MTTNYLFCEGKDAPWCVGYTVFAVHMDKFKGKWDDIASNPTITRHFMHLTYLFCNGKDKVKCCEMELCGIPCLLYSCDLFPHAFLFKVPAKKGQNSPGFTKKEIGVLLPQIRKFFAVPPAAE